MDFVLYSVWHSIRGFTAPIFMFTAGTVFTYLLYRTGSIDLTNLRVRKGLLRAILLLAIAYFLRFPTFKISQLGNISDRQWDIFFSVDVLHLIAIGLISIIAVAFVIQRIKLNSIITFSALTLIVFGSSFSVNSIGWGNLLPHFLAAYLTKSNGSLFPLFPWLGYMFAGATLGYYLSIKPVINKEKISKILLVSSILLIASSYLVQLFYQYVFDLGINWTNSFSFTMWRLGIVLLFNSLVIYSLRNIVKLPKIISLYGKHSLSIYIVHLIAIYGSAVVAGLSYIYGNSLTVFECVIVLILLNVAMMFMCYMIDFMSQKKHVVSNFINIVYRKLLPGVK